MPTGNYEYINAPYHRETYDDGNGLPIAVSPTNPLPSLTATGNGAGGYDTQQSNASLTLFASAARTTLQQSADQSNPNARGVQIVLNVTAASGTGGLTVTVVGKDPVSGTYYALNASPTAVTATGTTVYELYPGDGAASGGVTQRTSGPLPRVWGIKVAVGDASSYTYSIGVSTIV